MKKITALVLCLVLMMALCACGGTSIESYEEAPVAPPETAEAPEAAEEAENTAPGYSAYAPETVVGTINGKDVTWMEYCYWLTDYVSYLQQLSAAYGITLNGWDANDLSSTDTNGTVVLLNAQRAVLQHHAVQDKAEELGIALDEADRAMLLEVVEANADQGLGDADGVCTEEELAAFDAYLAERNVDRAFFDYLNEVSLLADKLYIDAYGENNEKYADEEVAAFAAANGFMAAKHILLLTKDMSTGEALPEEEIASQKALAEDLLAQLQAVEDKTEQEELFDKLMAEYTEDNGYESNPDGYVFGEGQMVPEFENAVKALEEYGLSGIVESSYGYHIVFRIPVDPDGVLGNDQNGNPVTLRSQAVGNAFNADMQSWMDAAEVVWNEGFEALDLTAVFG